MCNSTNTTGPSSPSTITASRASCLRSTLAVTTQTADRYFVTAMNNKDKPCDNTVVLKDSDFEADTLRERRPKQH